ncbi:MAG: DJ-1/PfpI family protein [Acidiferrobacterales bacterium]|jgi:4-methyl-5(b-hydroxyethyl)-thiazole monophosphate biosynthesis|nr:DJ-1/PfpI family protein [Acidiferrobacterales bacterium]
MALVLVPLAEGFEDLEAITITDLLRRAQIDVISAGLKPGPVKGSRGTIVVPDMSLDEALANKFDMIVLPGGQPGATHLEQDQRIHKLLQDMAANNKVIAAICAAPKVLATAGLLDGKQATSYPGSVSAAEFPTVKLSTNPVVIDGNIVTSRGPGTAMDFTLTLIEMLVGAEVSRNVEQALQRPL